MFLSSSVISCHFCGSVLNLLTRPLAFGQVGKGQCVYLERTHLQRQLLHTRAFGGISDSTKLYCEACDGIKGLD